MTGARVEYVTPDGLSAKRAAPNTGSCIGGKMRENGRTKRTHLRKALRRMAPDSNTLP